MIEIIREEAQNGETKEKILPKDIKQIGEPDVGDRIYVENQVYEQLHPYESQMEKAAYVLLGRFENYTGKQCTFVEAAIQLEEISFDGELPQWNDTTWGYIYKQLKHDYDSMVIVGWAMDIKGQLPNMTARMEAMHQSNFGGMHQILFLMDTLEREEAFYGNRNGHLYRREGFYIYYKKGTRPHSVEAENLILEKNRIIDLNEPEEAEEPESFPSFGENIKSTFERHKGTYRQQLWEEKESAKTTLFSPSLLVLVVICVLGFAAYQNYRKVNDMETVLAQMQAGYFETSQTETETEASTKMSQKQQTETSSEIQATSSETQEAAATEKPAGASTETKVQVETVQGSIEKKQNTQTTGTEQPLSNISDDNNTDSENSATGNGTATTETAADTKNAKAAESSTADATAADTKAADTTAANTQAALNTANTTNSAVTAPTEGTAFLQQGYYIVQKGDSLVGICRKVYQTTAMMDKVCEANAIDDPDAIYAGQYLTLPN